MRDVVRRAASIVRNADALLVCAGAGMGVDSGLPDFRGTEGFWKAYPPLHGREFEDMASPTLFAQDRTLAWGFYGHRLALYRATVPHHGFALLREWGDSMRHGARVFTSNVDGQFQRAGFPATSVMECHGSIHHIQCSTPCCDHITSADGVHVRVDEATLRAESDHLPRCGACGGLARPNILMFGDWQWVPDRTVAQDTALNEWLLDVHTRDGRVAVVELGAGRAVPTVRAFSQSVCRRWGGQLVRINPSERDAALDGAPGVAVPLRALDALTQMHALLREGEGDGE